MLPLLHIRILDILDILLVAFLIYKLYYFFRGTVGLKILLAIFMIFIGWRIVKALHMVMLTEIFGTFIGVGVILLVVVFQPEIREFLLMIGNAQFLKRSTTGKHKFLFFKASGDQLKPDLDAIARACQKMSESKTGALIVISRTNALENFIKTGTEINALVSDRLIENIFFKNSPLHDGAMIITKKNIVAAGVILPVSSSNKIPKEFGLRHRAAMGIAEETDAISVVVSEETGEIAICKDRVFSENISPVDLKEILDKELSE
ncbi:MAG: diadenylate cyclase CdaA [Bacteroidales bacterium]|nr:diadenylate cyclase CdaA [Bacteroidales bacterium]